MFALKNAQSFQNSFATLRIPTLLGLALLIGGLIGGVVLVNQTQILRSEANITTAPKNIQLANISSNKASIYWTTDEPTLGYAQIGTSESLGTTFLDDRDKEAPQSHRLHFVTFNNLTPNTTYYVKVTTGTDFFPKEPLSFTTTLSQQTNSLQPLTGVVLDESLQVVDEALIVLEIQEAQHLATITKVAGNFVLPLADIYNLDLTTPFDIQQAKPSAKLTAFNFAKESQMMLQLPIENPVLPTIILGQNTSVGIMKESTASPSAQIPYTPNYDFDKDGVITSLDVSFLYSKVDKTPVDKNADLNRDGKVNQKDIDQLNLYLRSGGTTTNPSPAN